MTKELVIPLAPYWSKIVDHYYAHIENDDDGDDIPVRLSIWEWLEQDFNAIRFQPWKSPSHEFSRLIFETESELVFFKLRWA